MNTSCYTALTNVICVHVLFKVYSVGNGNNSCSCGCTACYSSRILQVCIQEQRRSVNG
ncbi:hypothetical protein BDF19DRAFT_460282 [Syncephalis fuscata]|nr:hypothetical protein BDF19DRAFT_460282 [Syncephalis fuscata]